MKRIEVLLKPFAGYIYFGMYTEANEELECLPQDAKIHPLVLEARLILLMELQKWEEGSLLGESLCKLWPDNVEFHFKTAHCFRELNEIQEAKDILLAAPVSARETALFYYTLACYDAKLGNHGQARDLIRTCFRIDPTFRELALDDVDLESLWTAIIV